MKNLSQNNVVQKIMELLKDADDDQLRRIYSYVLRVIKDGY